MPRTSGWCSNGCARRVKAGRSLARRCSSPRSSSSTSPIATGSKPRRGPCRPRAGNRAVRPDLDPRPRRPRGARQDRRRRPGRRPCRRNRRAWRRAQPARQARPCRRDHRLPRLGPRRADPVGRRNERAAARDGGHAALGPVQPRPPDLGEARPRRDREIVRAEDKRLHALTSIVLPRSRDWRRASPRRQRRRGEAIRLRLPVRHAHRQRRRVVRDRTCWPAISRSGPACPGYTLVPHHRHPWRIHDIFGLLARCRAADRAPCLCAGGRLCPRIGRRGPGGIVPWPRAV